MVVGYEAVKIGTPLYPGIPALGHETANLPGANEILLLLPSQLAGSSTQFLECVSGFDLPFSHRRGDIPL